MEPTAEKVTFDFSKDADVLKAFQLSGEHSVNQTLPVQNITGIQRAANGALRLAEVKLRYEMFKEKVRKSGGSEVNIPLLDNGQKEQAISSGI